MKPDLIITWPTSCDFPVWRSFLRNNRFRFDKVFIVMSNTNVGHDYSSFLESAFKNDDVVFIEKGDYIDLGDWRSSAVNAALAQSKAEWVWFTEQDFFIEDPEAFFKRVDDLSTKNDFLYVTEQDRVHPACMFVKREFIDKTKKDFGVVPDKVDHFGIFVQDLEKAEAKSELIGEMGDMFYHMNGLTHNYKLIEDGTTESIYQPGLFQLYNAYARMQAVEQSPEFLNLSFKVDALLSPICKFFRGK